MTTSLMLAALALATQAYAPRVGAVHESFVLPSIDTREPIALDDFHGNGRPLLLIHFASW